MLIEELQVQSGLSRSQLQYLAATASNRYKIYTIPKRSGGRRRIAHPSRALKSVQRWINKSVITRFPVHECATAYRKGARIERNALAHARTRFTLRMDFQSFFPSFRSEGIGEFVSMVSAQMALGLSAEDVDFLCSIATRHGSLTIGAPSSPAITNAMMFDFDAEINRICGGRGLIYTRYADDVFISATRPDQLNGMYQEVKREARGFEYAKLRINSEKTAYLSRRYRRSITGLIITPDGKVSLGRSRKREIKSLVYKELNGGLEQREKDRLRGLVAFAWDCERTFFHSLQKKYGGDGIRYILGQRPI